MALGATICKAFIDISDIDRGYYESRSLTIAQHPSETSARMMVRLLAWALYAGEHTEFGRGLSTDDEPAVYETNEAGDIARAVLYALDEPPHVDVNEILIRPINQPT